MKHGGGVFNKKASLVYSTLNSAEKARLFSITESEQTVQMTPRGLVGNFLPRFENWYVYA